MNKIPYRRTDKTPITRGRRVWTIFADETNEGLVLTFQSPFAENPEPEEILPQNIQEIVGAVCTYVVTSITGTSDSFHDGYVDRKSQGGYYDC